MKLVYGISRWTNANTIKRLHIDDSFGKPLCIKSTNPYRQHTYETAEGEPTCKKCIAKYKCWFCGEPATGFVLGACTCDRCGRQVARGFDEG